MSQPPIDLKAFSDKRRASFKRPNHEKENWSFAFFFLLLISIFGLLALHYKDTSLNELNSLLYEPATAIVLLSKEEGRYTQEQIFYSI